MKLEKERPIPVESEIAISVAPSPGDIPDFSEWSEAVRTIESSIRAAIPEGEDV